jgi:hypothetical protein
VYAPADLEDNARLLACIRAALPTVEGHAGLVANLYTDLLINDRLQRDVGLDMAGVYKKIVHTSATESSPSNGLWELYLRIYEVLWSLPSQTLLGGDVDPALNLDATLGARLVRAYGKHWIDGAGRFAVLCLSYLREMVDEQGPSVWAVLRDTQQPGHGEVIPDGMVAIGQVESDGAVHPRNDPNLGDIDDTVSDGKSGPEHPGQGGARAQTGGHKNEYRSPKDYVELMKSLGVDVDESELIIRYYKERARPHLIKFPTRTIPGASEPLPEGLEPWQVGSPMSRIDWMQSVIRSPHVIPGVTTVRPTGSAATSATTSGC